MAHHLVTLYYYLHFQIAERDLKSLYSHIVETSEMLDSRDALFKFYEYI